MNLIQKYLLNAWYVLVSENSTVKRYPLEDTRVKKDTHESITYMRICCKLLRSEQPEMYQGIYDEGSHRHSCTSGSYSNVMN